MTTNTYKLAEALSEWAFNVAKSVLPNVKVPPTSTMGKMMTLLGINPASYSIYNELGFLVEPSIRAFVAPMVERYVGQLPDEQIPDIARMYVGAFRKRAAERGYVDVFGVQLGEQSFVRLEELFDQKFGKNERDNQEIRGAIRDDGDLGRYE